MESSWLCRSSAVTRLRFLLLLPCVFVFFFVGTASKWTFSTRPAESCLLNRWRRCSSVASMGTFTRKRERGESGSGMRGS